MPRLLFCIVSLLHLVRGQGVWSDSVNSYTEDFDYECSNNTALVGIASIFSTTQLDRQWEYQCGAGSNNLANVVSTVCTLQAPIQALGGDIEYICPNDGYLGGFQSQFDPVTYDRLWTPYCCERPYAALVNCISPTTGWENDIRGVLNFTAPDGHVIAGVTSFYFNRDRRWRYTTCAIEVNCTDPGIPDNSQRQGDSFLYRDIVTYTCNHGYYQSEGPEDGVRTCQQDGLWSETAPVCTECGHIENCADIRCTNITDHTCFECESYNGPGLGEAGYINLIIECQPLCSWVQGYCYPGVCSNGLTSCNCSIGFSGPDCLNITVSPELLSCSLTLWTSTQQLQVDCSNISLLPLFTNILPQQLIADWSADFVGPAPLITPMYVVGYQVGVASSNIHTSLFRAANPIEPVSMVTIPCNDPAPSPDSSVGMSMCSSIANSTHLANHTFLHGDSLLIETTVLNGGYVDINDLDNDIIRRYYYSGQPTVGSVIFILDVNPPVHCSLTSSTTPCIVGQTRLDLGQGITGSNLVDIHWGGWLDEPSGIISYTIDIYHMSVYEDLLREVQPSITTAVFNDSSQFEYQYSMNVSDGAYSVVMKIFDYAGNIRYTRSLILVDNSSQLLVGNTTSLRVETAVPSTEFLWINYTTLPVVVSGRGHFYNTHFLVQDLLATVANYTPAIATEYDHPLESGAYPRAGTPNALGVTQMRYNVIIDQEGGVSEASLTQPVIFTQTTDDLALEEAVLDIEEELMDGDSVRVWFQASDYLNHEVIDSILFHVDSTSPVLEDLWLEWNGVTQLALHGTESLLDLNIQFHTSDPHSGILSLEYWIGTEPGSMNVAWGQIEVQNVDRRNCTSQCVCDSLHHCSFTQYTITPSPSHFTTPSSHITLHDTEYYIVIMAANHAHLTSSLHHTITTDITPPITGVVMDTQQGSHDLDYTNNLTLNVMWSEFFDRETSILLYQYHFGMECINSSYFSYPLNENDDVIVMETTDTFATWLASVPGPGTYYVTVVTYNHALQASLPACSDGITIDISPPVINEIIIQDTMATADVIYISTDYHINISWIASDNVGIHDYLITAISEDALIQGQSANFTSVGRQSFFSLVNSDLISNGNTFYIIVKATDLASHETELTFGPVKVDITPPVARGNLTIERIGDHMTVTWYNDSFTDDESGIKSLEYSIGCSEYGSQVMELTSLPSSSPLSPCTTPHCISFNTLSLSLVQGHIYHITIIATNNAGLQQSMTSSGFMYIHGSPTGGQVIDLDPQMVDDNNNMCIDVSNSDTDLIINSDWVSAHWIGFDHAYLNVTYSIGLGSIPNTDDIIPFHEIGTETHYSFNNLTLISEEQYYITVIASNEYGTTNASSDGFIYLSNVNDAVSITTVADGNNNGIDIDYQYSISSLTVQWQSIPSLTPYISYYLWSVFLVEEPMSFKLTLVRDYENMGIQTSAVAGGMELRQGEVYVNAIQACLSTPIPYCLSPVYSDGVYISTYPQVSSFVHAIYTPLEWLSTSSYGKLEIEWSPFHDIRIAYYEWAIGTGEPGYELLTEWNQVEWYKTSVITFLNSTLSLHKTNTLTIQGYNAAGLYSRTGVELYWNVDGEIIPQSRVPRSKLIVYDIPEDLVPILSTSDWRDIEYSEWDPIEMELDYTNSAHSLSVAWPDLRYMVYNYSVSTTPTFTSCDNDGGMACGTTIANSVSIPNLELENGQRYYVCVQAVRDDVTHATPTTPNILTACTNGITVDLTPPTGSCVEIRPVSLDQESDLASASGSGLGDLVPFQTECVNNGSQFQTSNTDMHIVWSPFHDVEWYGTAVHASGVAYYEYAIGAQPGESDVIPFTKVGVVNDVIVTGLRLQSGYTYYATIRAYDFTGQWSDIISPGVTVDLTPPTGPSHFTLVTMDTTYSTIPLFVDIESGVSGMEIALGSQPGSSDLLEWTAASYGNGIGTYINQAGIRDGQLVFASIQVWNGARLSNIYSSLGHIHDSTPPVAGIVYDILSHDMSRDQDHTPFLSELSARWSEWSDPHTPIVEYYWSIVTMETGHIVQDFLSVGVATDATRKGLTLSPGVTYYIIVKGCNMIGQCSESASNGITVDVTPPITGWIHDGLRGDDQQYQSSRSYIAAHWSGFHDTESSLHSYIIWAGMWPGDNSLVPQTTLPPSMSSFIYPLTIPLPTNITVYVHLVAISNAGHMTSATSNGVFVDTTHPIITNIIVDTEWAGSVVMATQYSNTALRVTWNTDNPLSPIQSNYWSILSYPGTVIPWDIQTVNNRDSGTISGLSLSDGAMYSIIVVSCNAVGLCTQSQTNTSILIDSIPPVDGYFAVETNSTFPRSVAIPDGMEWRNRIQAGDSRITVAFYGFSDIHSEISEYWSEIGTSFGQSDLSMGSQILSPSQDIETGSWTATVQTAGHVSINDTLYITLWAVNGVGLESKRIHGSFIVEEVKGSMNRGNLRLLRSSQCVIDSCMGHCTCAARGDLCPLATNDIIMCMEVGSDVITEDQQVGVVNVASQETMATENNLFTSITDKLIGRWLVPVPSPYQRLEWTVGDSNGPGNGLFDTSTDQIWQEAGNSSTAIFSVNPLHPLLEGETYVFYVRGWLNYTHYAVFQSNGITVDTSSPRVVPGGRIREGELGTEIDYTANQTHIEVSWNGVFIEDLSTVYSTYQLGIGTIPGSDNIVYFSSILSSSSYSAIITGIFSHGLTYYTTLRITTPLSVTMDTISDGFTVDITPPEVGVVLDGLDNWDNIAQSDTLSLSARWTGFHDVESGIHHYEMGLSESSEAIPDQYVNMGIRLRGTLTGLELEHGMTYYIHIVAVNNAGVWSQSVSSNGITIDTTRPEHIQCQWEEISSLESINPGTSPCNYTQTEYDVTILPPSMSFIPLSGCYSHLVSHSHPHSLTISTTPQSLYTFSFWLTWQPGESGCGHVTPLLARVMAPGLDEVISVQTWNGDILHRWSRFQFQFTASDPNSTLTLTTLSDQYGIVFDRFIVSRCHTSTSIPINDVITNSSSVFHVSQEHMSGMWTRLRASWEVGEGEGDGEVREYKWTIGTTVRGEQLQSYTSTGSIPFGVSNELSTFHTQRLYISVLVWNHAGLESVVYGGPYIVDYTPPEINEGGGVRDGGVDLDYQDSAILQADWSDIIDPESGIEECSFMIGTTAGFSDLHPHTPTINTSSHITHLTNITHGTFAVTTVTCRNAAGLQSTFSSDGVTILQTPPTNYSAYLAVSSPFLTVYQSRDNHVASRNVTLHWGGFIEPAGTPLHYQVCIGGVSGECVMVGTNKKLTIDGVGSFDEEEVCVTALNLAGHHSSPLCGRVVFQTTPPIDNGADVNVTWVNASLHFDWSNKFISTSPLTFELSLGTIAGSGIIRKWVELDTDHTHYTVSDDRLNEATDYFFLTLVAISRSGLHTTASYMESGLPLNT